MRSGSPAHVSLVAYYFGEPQNDALKIGAQVLSEEGRPLEEGDDSGPGEVALRFGRPVRFSWSRSRRSASLPGRYSLRLILRDAATGKGGHASAPFLVR